MRAVRLLLGILLAMATLSLLVECIEFLIVYTESGKSLEYLSSHQSEYFDIRNQNWILLLKVIYTFIAAIISSYIGTIITKTYKKSFIIGTIMVQTLAFAYATLLSAYKDSLNIYYWVLLWILVISGTIIGNHISQKSEP